MNAAGTKAVSTDSHSPASAPRRQGGSEGRSLSSRTTERTANGSTIALTTVPSRPWATAPVSTGSKP